MKATVETAADEHIFTSTGFLYFEDRLKNKHLSRCEKNPKQNIKPMEVIVVWDQVSCFIELEIALN